ncbi:MAG: hypothetical protein WB988_13330, partial [Candidatus Nitrosopolaris sp.]
VFYNGIDKCTILSRYALLIIPKLLLFLFNLLLILSMIGHPLGSAKIKIYVVQTRISLYPII